MTTRTGDRVDEWDSTSFSGGYGGLRDLASREFSGAVVAGPARLFMLRGSVVGVLDGDLEDFEDADGTAREAPHDALPLLAVMQERSEEVRAKYYTEDTAISEVDRTLADGNFTGFVELSENVLSGDYYLVYHQGRSMSVAWVGSSSRLITGDDAFEQADDEVGIYEVRPVDIEVLEIPEPTGGSDGEGTTDVEPGTPAAGESGAAAGESGAAAAGGSESPTADATESDDAGATDEPTDRAESPDRDEDAAGTGERESGDGAGGAAPERRSPPDAKHATARERGGDDEREADSGGQSTAADVESTAPDGESTTADGESTAASAAAETGDRSTGPSQGSGRRDGSDGPGEAATDGPAETKAATGQTRSPTERPDAASVGGRDRDAGPEAASADRRQASPGAQSTAGRDRSSGGATSPADLETRSIPSLDPERTATASDADGAAPTPETGTTSSQATARNGETDEGAQTRESARAGGTAADRPARDETAQDETTRAEAAQGETTRAEADAEPAQGESGQGGGTADDRSEGGGAAEHDRLRKELETREAEIERLEGELADLESEREDLAAERDRLREELEEARSEIERLEADLADAQADAGTTEGERVSPAQAIAETNLFVRYRSKGDPTLEDAHAGDASREAVDANLRLEYHTTFDDADATVNGEPFDEYLRGTVQYRFADWLVSDLLYEIRDSGGAAGLKDLYDALPRVDRIELNGQVSVAVDEDGTENRSQKQFDVVIRDRMGNPLAVATINNSREPASEALMTGLIQGAEQVGRTSDSLAGAFLVTESFFEPGALEATEEATSGGLLSRDKRKSFVNLSRKGGYHLCLVEARNSEFHLAVPEL